MKSGMTMMDMVAEVRRQSSERADYVVDTRRLKMESCEDSILMKMLNDDGNDIVEPLDVRTIAHRQIGTHLKIPAPYYDRMLDENPGLLAENVNSWFSNEPAQRMLRTIDGAARAFLSSSYKRIDNFEILQTVLPIIGEIEDARFESCQVTDRKMYIKVINTRLEAEISVGDVVQAGIMISNSEVGYGSFTVQPLILRLVCMNGMVVNDAKARKIHKGTTIMPGDNYLVYSDKTLAAEDHAFMLKVQDTVRAAVDETKFHRVVEMMREAESARMTTNDIPAVVKLASKDYKLNDKESDGVLNQLIEDCDYTLYGLSNAVTRYSQDVENYDRATELEGIGYNMLSMPRQRWNNLNQQVLQAAA